MSEYRVRGFLVYIKRKKLGSVNGDVYDLFFFSNATHVCHK